MIGEPCDLKPSTSSLELPPLQTVAANVTWSDGFLPRKCWIPMPQEGSGERSGSDEAGGLVRVGTLAGSRGRTPLRPRWCFAAGRTHGWNGPHELGLTTLTVSVALDVRGVRCRNRCHSRMTLTVTLYLPSGTLATMKPVSTPQPR